MTTGESTTGATSDTGGTTGRTAVVLMAYGTPTSTDQIEAYYTDIRRGRPPTPELLAELIGRYDAIGGLSPLAERTEAQRAGLAAALEEIATGEYEVAIGLKHADPKIEATVDRLAGAGHRRVVGIVLAPHDSTYSIGQYLDRLREAAAAHDMVVGGVRSWATEPAFVEFVAADLARRLEAAPEHTRVLFTAHSLPERIIAAGDVYPAELRATAEAVADRLDLTEHRDWQIAWQSAGRTPEPWLGPDVLEVIDELAGDDDVAGVIVSAVGFVADHLEVLYDLDIEAASKAAERGLTFDRTACVNADPAVLAALARRVHAEAAALDG